MEFIEIDYKENQKVTGKWLDEDTQLKEPEALKLERDHISIGVQEDNKIIGWLSGSIFFNAMHVELFAVDSTVRSKGIGGKLLEKAIEIAKEKKLHFITLETMSFNAPKFYQKHGFEIMKEIDDSPLDNTSHFFMFKDIRWYIQKSILYYLKTKK